MLMKFKPRIDGNDVISFTGFLKPLFFNPSIFASMLIKFKPRIDGEEIISFIGSLKPLASKKIIVSPAERLNKLL